MTEVGEQVGTEVVFASSNPSEPTSADQEAESPSVLCSFVHEVLMEVCDKLMAECADRVIAEKLSGDVQESALGGDLAADSSYR